MDVAVTRGRDYLYMAQIALLIHHVDVEGYFPSALAIDAFLKQNAKTAPPRALRQKCSAPSSATWRLPPQEVRRLHQARGQAQPSRSTAVEAARSCEFVFIALMIYKFPDATIPAALPTGARVEAGVRSQFKDVMFNKNVTTVMRRYIDLAKVTPDTQPIKASQSNASPRHKRSRQEESDDDDEDGDVPLSSRRRAANGSSSALDINPDAGTFSR